MVQGEIRNFGGNVVLRPAGYQAPRNLETLLSLLSQSAGGKIRAIGSRHSWSQVIEAEGLLVDMQYFDEVSIRHDERGPVVKVGGGCSIQRLLRLLAKANMTLPAVGLISEQTIAGAISTGTHGSGRACLSHYVETVHIAHFDPKTGEAKVSQINQGPELRAAKCALGCLGIIVAVELRPRSSYRIEEFMAIYESLDGPLSQEAAYPLQQFYYLPWRDRYLGQHRKETLAPRSRLASLYRWYWYLVIDIGLHLVLSGIVKICRLPRLAKPFLRYLASNSLILHWHVVDRSQDMLIMEHELFRHIEIELFVKRRHLAGAMELAKELIRYCDSGEVISQGTRDCCLDAGTADLLDSCGCRYTHHYPVCIRRIVPDDTCLSMSSGGDEDYYALSFISYDPPSQREGFLLFARLMAHTMFHRFQARCHWGKIQPHLAAQLGQLYPELPTFRDVCQRYDSAGVFRNQWLESLLFDHEQCLGIGPTLGGERSYA
jgi:hypothetical protein